MRTFSSLEFTGNHDWGGSEWDEMFFLETEIQFRVYLQCKGSLLSKHLSKGRKDILFSDRPQFLQFPHPQASLV
jgi:hypothetical protein